jgi:uncharacterized protein YgiM (DUF1202 family)
MSIIIISDVLAGEVILVLSRLSYGIAAVFALAGFVSPAAAQQVTVERDSELRAEARPDAAVVAKVKQGTTGEVTAKNGAWLNLKTAEGSGWLFSFNVRFAAPGQGAGSGGGDASALGRVFGPRQNVKVTSTIGVRGIDKEDLKQATFNAEQMNLLDTYVSSRDSAASRARSAGLAATRVDYLDEKPK